MKAKLMNKWDGTRILYVEFSPDDLLTVKLTQWDYAQLREPSKGVADWLLDAELIARRIEEQEAKRDELTPIKGD